MLTTIIPYGLLIALAIALVFAAFTDIQRRQIDNWLNAAIALGAPLFWLTSENFSLWPGAALQLGFALIVCAILIGIAFIGYKINVVILGGGDIKLLGALSLWFAPLSYMMMLWFMALCGGVLAVGFVARRVILKPKNYLQLPYGVAIAFGGLWMLYSKLLPAAAMGAGPA